MTVYFAGGAHYDFLEGKPILESFWYKRNALKAMQKTDQFFLDSGAFSAWSTGAVINVDDYAAFIHDNVASIHVASNLDDTTKTEKLSYENQKALESLGCKVAPVFHTREDPKWLKRYIDEGYDYIFIGGMVPESTAWLTVWLDDLWEKYLTDDAGRATVKIHGFGLTVGRLIERYPWYSVDSTTWLNGARFGTALLNFPGRRLVHCPVSKRNPAAKQLTSNHIDNLNNLELDILHKQLEEFGITLEELQTDTNKLLHFNTLSFLQWERDYGFPETFKRQQEQQGLFL